VLPVKPHLFFKGKSNLSQVKQWAAFRRESRVRAGRIIFSDVRVELPSLATASFSELLRPALLAHGFSDQYKLEQIGVQR
jgi:hypothetical protein